MVVMSPSAQSSDIVVESGKVMRCPSLPVP